MASNDSSAIVASSSRFDALIEESEEVERSSYDWNEQSSTDLIVADDIGDDGKVVESEPNPIRDSHEDGSPCQHSPSSDSPDEGGGSSDGALGTSKLITNEDAPVSCDKSQEQVVLPCEDSSVNICNAAADPHDDNVTVTSSDIEIIKQDDMWSVMSNTSSILHGEEDSQISHIVVSAETIKEQQKVATELNQLRMKIQYQERRIADLVSQNQKLEKKSKDLLVLKASRNQQSLTESKLLKKLSDKEAEVAELLQEGEKLAETNGKFSREIKRLKASLAEQENQVKKGLQAEEDRDKAKEELLGMTVENNKLRATLRAIEDEASKLRTSNELIKEDVRKRDEKIEQLMGEIKQLEAEKEVAANEIKRLGAKLMQMSSHASQAEIASKGIEEITKGLSADFEEERSKNIAQQAYVISLEKRLAKLMESQRDAAEMVALANAPLLESIRQLKEEINSDKKSHTEVVTEKEKQINDMKLERDNAIRQFNDCSTALHMLRLSSAEIERGASETAQKLRELESSERLLELSNTKLEHIVKELRSSLSDKEAEIQKLYSRIREEVENAKHENIEKEQKILTLKANNENLESVIESLREELSSLERVRALKNQLQGGYPTDTERRPSETIVCPSYIGAQAELVEVIAKHERAMRQVTMLQSKLNILTEENARLQATKTDYFDLRMRYENLLEAHGEKIEKIEELELDLADVKKMYKEQVQLLLGNS